MIEQENVELFCLAELNEENLITDLADIVKTSLLLITKTIYPLPKNLLFTNL